MADVLTGVTETAANSMQNVSQVAQLYLQQESKLLSTVTDFSALAVKGAASIALPRSGGFTVGSKGENVAVDAQTSAYVKDVITLDQHRVIQFLVEDIADAESRVAVVQDYLMKASKDLALDVDNKIITELALASASAPNHQIKYIDTTGDVIARGDVLAARALLTAQHIDPRECYIGIGPEKEAEMLDIDDFIHAEKYGSNEPIMNGEIGRVYGMKVILHTGFSGNTSVWHPTAVGVAFHWQARVQRDYDLANLASRYSLDYLGGFEVLDAGKRNVDITKTN